VGYNSVADSTGPFV